MLLFGIMRVLFSVGDWITQGLPKADLTGLAGFTAGVRDALAVGLQLDVAFPLHEAFDAAVVFIIIWGALGGFAFVKKVIGVIPIIGGHD